MITRAAVLVAALLAACGGEPFTASPGGASGASGTPDAGAADAGDGGAAQGGTAAPGGRGGTSSAGMGGTSSAGMGGTSSGGVSSCLPGWEGSAFCDTCTSSPPPPSGETCAQVLACYVEKGGPDAVVKVAHDVLACRCG